MTEQQAPSSAIHAEPATARGLIQSPSSDGDVHACSELRGCAKRPQDQDCTLRDDDDLSVGGRLATMCAATIAPPIHAPMLRFAALLHGARPSSQSMVVTHEDLSGPGSPDGKEDGSAEALLSLMQSVRANRARELAEASTGASTTTTQAAAVPPPSRDPLRRHYHDQHGDGGDSSSAEADHRHSGLQQNKKRKSTHTVRKEEKAVLVDEIKSLQERLAFLQGQVFLPAAGESAVEPEVSNVLLRQAIYEQQLRFATGRSILSRYLTSELSSPLHTYLHLTSDLTERRATLLSLKPTLLAEGKQYIEHRSRLLDLARHHAVVERFETTSGDACCIRFYVDQFPSGRFSVKNIHDVTQFFTANLEMSITESMGHITVREDDDSGDPTLSQHRLVVSGSHGIIVETNTVVFSHFNAEENYGILAVTYVDQDDLHPYRAHERIRQDVMGVSLITQESGVVVVRRWAHVRMRKSHHVHLPEYVLQTARENLGNWGDAMMQFVRERLYTTTA